MLVYHPDYERHVQGPNHVESPKRLTGIITKLEKEGLMEDWIVPTPAAEAQILEVHKPEYLTMLHEVGEGLLDMDTYVHPETPELAILSAGGALAAGHLAEKGSPTVALLRPPGHHAGPDFGGGFCYLNNIAIAARDLLKRHERVAILDWDAHHGNGTEAIFRGDPRILYVSSHQDGIYPGTGSADEVGKEDGKPNLVNLPVPARSGDTTYELIFHQIVEPIVREFKPSVILSSWGVDAHYRDPIVQLSLSSTGYIDLATWTLDLARGVCDNRIAFLLEGGYHVPAVSEVVTGLVARIKGKSIHLQFEDVEDTNERGRDAVDKARNIQREFWDV